MSSWQQAISLDVHKGKRRDCPVVLNRNQEKNIKTGREDADQKNWICGQCSSEMPASYYRCEKCGVLKAEERAFRLELRAKGGEIGRGGGYKQISDCEKKDWNSDDEEIDEFGRRKKRAAQTASSRQRAAVSRLVVAPRGRVPLSLSRSRSRSRSCGAGRRNGAGSGTAERITAPRSRSRSRSHSRSRGPSTRNQNGPGTVEGAPPRPVSRRSRSQSRRLSRSRRLS
eukprot:TRINITY_DN50649_c0_g1_i1.p1 TRINITY_DN50649_c0_g1~~TRINITY_DN50649_c0_g1_i1.p1  ORF type:complete len:227 (-),score=16.23 TRINITY_DN50649_c0_g1_i1:80-760(-)